MSTSNPHHGQDAAPARAVMGDDEERTESIFYSAIAYEKLCQKPSRLLTRIVYPADKPFNCVP